MLLPSGPIKEALKSGLSDMEYLRSKVALTDDAMEDREENSDGEEEEKDDVEDGHGTVQPADSAYESSENTSKIKSSVSSKDKKQSKVKKSEKQEVKKINIEIITSSFVFVFNLKLISSRTHASVCCRWSQQLHSQ